MQLLKHEQMYVIAPTLRKPKQTEMALSTQVKDATEKAAAALREALAFAARTEHPVTISTLTDILVRLESMETIEELMEKFGKQEIPKSI